MGEYCTVYIDSEYGIEGSYEMKSRLLRNSNNFFDNGSDCCDPNLRFKNIIETEYTTIKRGMFRDTKVTTIGYRDYSPICEIHNDYFEDVITGYKFYRKQTKDLNNFKFSISTDDNNFTVTFQERRAWNIIKYLKQEDLERYKKAIKQFDEICKKTIIEFKGTLEDVDSKIKQFKLKNNIYK